MLSLSKIDKALGGILPTLMALVTGVPRYRPDVEWASGSWTYNVFRVYELIFGRRFGENGVGDTVRIEMSASGKLVNGRTYVVYAFHTWESAFIMAEHFIRSAFSWKPILPVRVWVPILHLRLANGMSMPVFQSPYIFAVALDSHGFSIGTNSSPLTLSYTMGAVSNGLLTIGTACQSSVSSVTYNSVTATQVANVPLSTRYGNMYMHYVNNPSSGANNVVVTASGSEVASYGLQCYCISFSGVSQSSPIDVSGTVRASTNLTKSVTTVSDNCWLVGYIAFDDPVARGIFSAGANTTLRDNNDNVFASCDSNAAKTPAGSYSLTMNNTVAEVCGFIVAGIAPAGAAATATYGTRMSLTGVGS